MTDVWSQVAAPGTDPALLARVVRRAASDPTGVAAEVRACAAGRRGAGDVATAVVARVADQAVLDEGPGDASARGWREHGVVVALAGDPAMPARLATITAPPLWLAMRGGPVAGDRPAVAIVGSRAASEYGRSMAAWLAGAAASAGVRVVSGGAVGIDAAAHGAALDEVGGTTVVLGCGHAVAYPRPHAATGGLFDRIRGAGGLLVSEGLADDQPRPWRVRARNRLIAGLADAVVVVEGSSRSGALVTATWAADHGQAVLAVPGDARASGSGAPVRLLRDGAGVCAEPADLFDAIGVAPTRQAQAVAPDDAATAPPARRDVTAVLPGPVADALVAAWPRSLTLDQLADRADVDVGPLLAAVTAAQVAGLLTRDHDGLRLRRSPR